MMACEKQTKRSHPSGYELDLLPRRNEGPAMVGFSRPSRDDLIAMLSGEELARLEAIGGGLNRRQLVMWKREHLSINQVRKERRNVA